MTEERVTLRLYESKLIWNRYVKYADYDLMGSRVLIIAGNEQHWMKYSQVIQFTPDFSVMVTSNNLLTSVSLLIIYNAPAMRWSCSGSPMWVCSESINGMFATQLECQTACRAPPGDCQPPPGQPQRKCIDASTIAVWNVKTCQYDTAPCSTGVCSDGNCVGTPPGTPRWDCSGAPNYLCSQTTPTGKYATQAECMAACKKGEDDIINDNLIWIIAVVLVGIYLLMKGKK